MDKTLIKEIIIEFEQISKIVNNRLSQLYTLLGEEKPVKTNNNIKNIIDEQRNEIMNQVEELKRQAMSSISNTNYGGVPHNTFDIESMRMKMMKQIEEKKNGG